METATSLLIGQLADYLRGLTRRLDPGAGWYGEFLRRDPEGMRACLDGAAIPPWDVLASLLRDAGAVAGEVEYAARLRVAAVAAWDRAPGGERELRELLARASEQRAAAEAALARLTELRDRATAPAEAAELDRELSWLRDDTSRARARQDDLTSRLASLRTPPGEATPGEATPGHPLPVVPRPGPVGEPFGALAEEASYAEAGARAGAQPLGPFREAGHEEPAVDAVVRPPAPAPALGPRRREPDAERPGAPLDGVPGQRGAGSPGRAEGRWRRGGRRAGGARYAGAPAEVGPPSLPVEAPQAPQATPRGARFAHLAPTKAAPEPAPPGTVDPRPTLPPQAGPAAGPAAPPSAHAAPTAPPEHPAGQPVEAVWHGGGAAVSPEAAAGRPVVSPWFTADPAAPTPDGGGPGARPAVPVPAPRPGAGAAVEVPRTVARLVGLRAQGRGGEAHALLCEAAAWPAGLLPEFAAELGRAGLGADWATLLWEAASLPPDRLAAAAAALGEAGRDADCDALLRQGAGRPTAEIAEAALVLGAAGREREADVLLAAFVRLRTAEEAAALARRDPQWFAPRLLRAAAVLAGGKHRDLSHALRVAGIPLP